MYELDDFVIRLDCTVRGQHGDLDHLSSMRMGAHSSIFNIEDFIVVPSSNSRYPRAPSSFRLTMRTSCHEVRYVPAALGLVGPHCLSLNKPNMPVRETSLLTGAIRQPKVQDNSIRVRAGFTVTMLIITMNNPTSGGTVASILKFTNFCKPRNTRNACQPASSCLMTDTRTETCIA